MHKREWGSRDRVTAICAAILAVVLAWSTWIAARGGMDDLETRLFYAVYGMGQNWLPIAVAVTQLGSIWLLIGLVGLLFVVRWNPDTALAMARAGVISYVVVMLLKLGIDRARPMYLLDIVSRETLIRGNGFPSLHVALATVMSLTLARYAPGKWWWLAGLWIGLVAWSRLYLGVHAPLDIIGGFCIGVLAVLAIWTWQQPLARTSGTAHTGRRSRARAK